MERKTITGRIHGYHWLPGVTYGNGQVIIQDDESGMFWAYTADRETVRAAAKLRRRSLARRLQADAHGLPEPGEPVTPITVALPSAVASFTSRTT